MSRSGRANLQTLTYLGGALTETPGMSAEIARRIRACWMRIRRYLRELYDQPKVALSLKTRMVKAEAIESLLYGYSTWTLRQEHYSRLRTLRHRVLLCIIGAQRKRLDRRMTSYNHALEITGCESIERTLRSRRILWAGALIRMSGGRLPNWIMLENLEGAVRRGRGAKEKGWTDCVKSSNIRAFGIKRGIGKRRRWRQRCWLRQLGGGLWPRGGKKTRLDFAKRRERQREWEGCDRTQKRRTCEATPICLVDESN